MSATFPNLSFISKWLGGTFYISNFRPIEVKEYAKLGKTIVGPDGQKIRELESSVKGDFLGIVPLIRETILSNGQVLVFCSTKKDCESKAKLFASTVIDDIQSTIPEEYSQYFSTPGLF